MAICKLLNIFTEVLFGVKILIKLPKSLLSTLNSVKKWYSVYTGYRGSKGISKKRAFIKLFWTLFHLFVALEDEFFGFLILFGQVLADCDPLELLIVLGSAGLSELLDLDVDKGFCCGPVASQDSGGDVGESWNVFCKTGFSFHTPLLALFSVLMC